MVFSVLPLNFFKVYRDQLNCIQRGLKWSVADRKVNQLIAVKRTREERVCRDALVLVYTSNQQIRARGQ